MQACFEPAHGCIAHSGQRPCCKLPFVHSPHLAPGQNRFLRSFFLGQRKILFNTWHAFYGNETQKYAAFAPSGHRIQHTVDVFPLHRLSAAIRRHRHSPNPLRHSRMLADSSCNLSRTDRPMADPTPHDAVSTLALLELLLAQAPPSSHSSDSSVSKPNSRQVGTAEPSQSHTEAAGIKPEVDSSLSSPTAVPSAGMSTQISAGTSAQTPSARTSTQTSSAFTPAQTLRGTTTQTSSACTSAQIPGDIWALAWQPLEASHAAKAQQAKHAQRAKHAQQANRSPSAVHATAKSPGLSSLRFWRQQQGPDDDGNTDKQQEQHYTSGQFSV